VRDIQQARAVLAKWRTGPMAEAITGGRSLIPLVDGTAGNPALLDAIDEFLSQGAVFQEFGPGVFSDHAGRITAAIIAADERMTS
jgi:hypothetical protein